MRTELKHLRKEREKHYLNSDGTITIDVYDKNIHYLNNGKYEEIDNTLVDKGEYYENLANDFHTIFTKNSNDLVNVTKDNYYLKIFLDKKNKIKLKKIKEDINYQVDNEIEYNYKLMTSKLKESIILNNRNKIKDKLEFIIDTNLSLELLENNKIVCRNQEEVIFTIDEPFMIDNNKNINNNISYSIKYVNDLYYLTLNLDNEWLNDKDRAYPVVIDPTIINGTGENVYDTYISSLSHDLVLDSREYFKVGVYESGNINRALLKFTLPKIGTSYNIVNATFYIKDHPDTFASHLRFSKAVNVHAINAVWDETTATWDNMHDKYDRFVENYFYPLFKTIVDPESLTTEVDITSLVKKWYAGTPNNGLMLKWNDEVYETNSIVYHGYSKTYDYLYEADCRPYLTITYSYQNGIEDYMSYNEIQYTNGISYLNNFNGNVTNIFELNKTISGKFPVILNAVNNTNDFVIDNLSTWAKGWKFNLEETISKTKIDNNDYLIYSDEDSTIHYLYDDGNGTFIEEDGLDIKVTLKNNNYEMQDTNGNKKIFALYNSKYLLTQIIDTENNKIEIQYTNGKLTKVIDADNEEINVTYASNLITITSLLDTAKINLNNNLITSCENKNGITSFNYNSYNLISKILDVNGLYVNYEYHSTNPHRLKNITYYGLNNTKGSLMNYSYGYNTTTITDEKGMKTTYTFNDQGNTLGTINYSKNNNKLSEAYGYADKFIQNVPPEYRNLNNKLNSSEVPIKYVNNLLLNSSFEAPLTNFNYTYSNATIYNGEAYTGTYSLKLDEISKITYKVPVSNYYTISFYLKNTANTKAILYKNNTKLDEININSSDYERYDLTGYFEANANLVLEFVNTSSSYLDDIQLETGEVANEYNMVNNSNFSNGLTDWEFQAFNNNTGEEVTNFYELINTSSGEKALKINSNPDISGSLSKHFPLSGKKGDFYRLSFWYKNEGVFEGEIGELGNLANIQFIDVEEDMGMGTMDIHLNRHATEWQFFTETFVSENDYSEFYLNVISQNEANSLYVTNFMLTKCLGSYTYEYDDRGNLVIVKDLSNNDNRFIYDKNNEILSSFDAKGNNFKYEYDNYKTSQVLKGISASGISNEFKYNENNDPVKTIINNVNPDSVIVDGNSYYIRAKGTEKYLKCNFFNRSISLEETDCNKNSFKFIKVGDYYKVSMINYNLILLSNKIYLTNKEVTDSALFKFKLNANGSYSFSPKSDETKNIGLVNNVLALCEINEDASNQQFYLEDIDTPLFVENKYIYSQDGKVLTKMIDPLNKETLYDVDPVTKKTNSITTPNNYTKHYVYNDQDQVIKIYDDKKEINYEFDNNNLLTNIYSGTKNYQITYNNFLNKNSIRLNNYNLLSQTYENNNGNLLSKTYGNGYKEDYTYDEFDRIKTISTPTTYKYFYNNYGQVNKIESANNLYKYYYDFANRLKKYIQDDNFKILYNFDNNSNIIEKDFSYNNDNLNIQFDFNKDDSITKLLVNNHQVNYKYDYLGRIINKNINNNLNVNYTYITNGNKTSFILDTIIVDEDTYKYEYDGLYNITNIYKNKKLLKSCEYDDWNQLICESDFELDLKYNYKYDLEGNMLSRKITNLIDNSFIKEDIFKYENTSWEDQLTKYNDIEFTYDEIGNMTSIGNKILTWEGKELKTFTNPTKNIEITYDYDFNRLRNKKIVNNIVTDYYYEDELLVIENRNGNIIKYIKDDSGSPVGFIYNNNTYFYKKNYQEDIEGIYDSNYNLVVEYLYDSWGNIIEIIDNEEGIGKINPYRYRSYYYEDELEMYWLESRFYNPMIARFISADSEVHDDFIGSNLYAYCGNNPINRSDDDGRGWFAKACVMGVAALAFRATVNVIKGEKVTKGLVGAFAGGFVGSLFGKPQMVIGAFTSAFAESAANEAFSYTNKKKKVTKKEIKKSVKKVAKETIIGGTFNTLGSHTSKQIIKPSVGRNPTKLKTIIAGKKARKDYKREFIATIYTDVSTSSFEYMNEVNQKTILDMYDRKKSNK